MLIQVSPQKLNLNLFPPRDDLPPFINITNPSYPPTILSGNISLEGITNDSSGIKAISANAHTFPFNGSMPIKPASEPSLISEGNLSRWSVAFNFTSPGVYRIVVTVLDNSNNEGYVETTVNVAPSKGTLPTISEPRIAFLRYTFTESAYLENGFYDFYYKYGFPPSDVKITTDLDKLTVESMPSTAETVSESDLSKLSNVTALLQPDSEFAFFPTFVERVNKAIPNATVTIIRDEDVHDGRIFYGNNKTNAFDVLVLFHNEYVTQAEYDNLRQFVNNGGIMVLVDANVFYAEVRYDRNNHTITLVKGHDWEFDGKAAISSVQERWYNENKEWIGGNFLPYDIKENLTFRNNPFNYTHFEEQSVNNQNAKIIIDYGIQFPRNYYLEDPSLKQVRVATYTLDYGKGKIIMLGLTGHRLSANELFLDFFDKLLASEIYRVYG